MKAGVSREIGYFYIYVNRKLRLGKKRDPFLLLYKKEVIAQSSFKLSLLFCILGKSFRFSSGK
ncbi:hypothetical protein B4065_2106 [Caldibacillus thermoamylovorans]|nr:hypothetical protein B4065_2106 [Caldibacillus thermoamylovorans]